MPSKAFSLALVAALMLAGGALAHHSFAMFDADKSVDIKGVVKELRWTNPHAWLLIVVTNEQGQIEDWAFEMGAPVGLVRAGWKPRTVSAGDKITVTMHPARDGTNAGQLLAVVLPDGRTLGDPSTAAPSP